MTLILWRGGDPFADEFTLEAGASVRCSRILPATKKPAGASRRA